MNPPHNRPKMAAIADALGLSRRTVSSVVNDKWRERRISEATARRVCDYLDAIGYVPSLHAQALKAGNTPHAVGILTAGDFYNHLTSAFERLVGIHRQLDKLEIVIAPARNNYASLRELAARGCRDLLWFHGNHDTFEFGDPERTFPLLRNFRRIVVYNYRFAFGRYEERLLEAGAHLVGVDRVKAYRQMARLLRDHGHRHAALVFPGSEHILNQVTEEAGVHLVHDGKPGLGTTSLYDQGCRLGEWLARLARDRRITAAILHNEEIAAAALVTMSQAGVRIPEDFSLLSWSGSRMAQTYRVPLTTADVPVQQMVASAQTLLSEDRGEAERHCFDAILHVRGSQGPAPQ